MATQARTHIERLACAPEHDFWLGFCAGQAEKVWLGVCPAFMVRPDDDQRDDRTEQVHRVADEYGLTVTAIDNELWVHRSNFDCGQWVSYAKNSIDYHRARAAACGIPKVDVDYHKRQ